jgi:hypothetical protein
MFFSLSLLGLRKVFKEGGNAVIGLAFSIGALLSLALIVFTDFSLGILFPFAKNIIFFIILLVIYLVVSNVMKADTTGKKIFALILAIAIALLAFRFMNDEGSWNPFGKYQMEGKATKNYIDEIKELTGGAEFGQPLDPADKEKWAELKYKQGVYEATTQKNFEAAAKHFGDVVMGFPNNYFDKSYKWLTERLWVVMQKENLKLMEGFLIAGEYSNRDGQHTLANSQYEFVIERGEELKAEIARQRLRLEQAKITKELIKEHEKRLKEAAKKE